MNIPQDTLQAVADAAFEYIKGGTYGSLVTNNTQYPNDWDKEAPARRAVIQHALDNPALAPFLAGGIGEYTDMELVEASRKADGMHLIGANWLRAFLSVLLRRESQTIAPFLAGVGEYADHDICVARNRATRNTDDKSFPSMKWLNAFLAALPRRESQALAEAIARAEKAEAECLSWKCNAEQAWKDHANISKELGEAVARAEKAEAELSSQLGILRPLSEMPKTVPDRYMAIFHWQDDFGAWITGPRKPTKGFFAILRLPSAEATPPAEPEPAAHVPLGPEDMKPDTWLDIHGDGEIVRVKSWGKLGVINDCRDERRRIFSYDELFKMGSKINTSLPDTGRWDKDAWRPCSKPAGKEVAK